MNNITKIIRYFMGHKYFEITEDDKENINRGIERFYFYGTII